MANYYSNPTENAAIGAVDKELSAMRKKARRLKTLHQRGLLTPEEETRARREFRGIYARFLREALGK